MIFNLKFRENLIHFRFPNFKSPVIIIIRLHNEKIYLVPIIQDFITEY